MREFLLQERAAECAYMSQLLERSDDCLTSDDLLAKASVEVRTIHASKGLEYERVVVDLNGFRL